MGGAKKKKEKEKKRKPIIRRHLLKGKRTGREGCYWRIQYQPPGDDRAYILDEAYGLARDALIALNIKQKSTEYKRRNVMIIDYPDSAG